MVGVMADFANHSMGPRPATIRSASSIICVPPMPKRTLGRCQSVDEMTACSVASFLRRLTFGPAAIGSATTIDSVTRCSRNE